MCVYVCDNNASSPCTCDLCKTKTSRLANDNIGFSRHITFLNILFLTLWILFIYLLYCLPSFSSQSLSSFKPYEILEIDITATDDQIKKVTINR